MSRSPDEEIGDSLVWGCLLFIFGAIGLVMVLVGIIKFVTVMWP